MSCICQYYAPAMDIPSELHDPGVETTDGEPSEPGENATEQPATDDEKVAVCASDLAHSRAENWLLKKKLHESEMTIQNLEQLVSTIVEKQHQILSEMFELRKLNTELQSQCRQQREYHLMERHALMKELHDAQVLQSARSKTLFENKSLAALYSTDEDEDGDGETEVETETEEEDDDDDADTDDDDDENTDEDNDGDEDDDDEYQEEEQEDDDDDDEDESDTGSDCNENMPLQSSRLDISNSKSRNSHRSHKQNSSSSSSSSSSDASDIDADESVTTRELARSRHPKPFN